MTDIATTGALASQALAEPGIPPTGPTTHRPPGDWWIIFAIFWVTSMVEGLGVSQIFAFVPLYLRGMGVAEPDRLRFIGIFGR